MLPNSSITAFSNSKTQKQYIDEQAKQKGLSNLKVITGDVVDYEFEPSYFDRVVSIEVGCFYQLLLALLTIYKLFEHMKNYELLMAKMARALKSGGKLFVHIFTHKTTPYDFEDGWMTTHFFTGGTMPSADLLLYFQKDLKLREQWWISGMNYAKTCEVRMNSHDATLTLAYCDMQDWLSKMVASKQEIWPHLEETYGKEGVTTWYNRWQIFYMACAELFAFEGGDTWGVSHYLFEKPAQ
jgi:cyclopropane fatty-acyl-phospholipid synthase-like methyltransferase